jgi:hypothetical protein
MKVKPMPLPSRLARRLSTSTAWVSSPDGLGETSGLPFAKLNDIGFGRSRFEVIGTPDFRGNRGRVEKNIRSTGYNYFTRLIAPRPGMTSGFSLEGFEE